MSICELRKKKREKKRFLSLFTNLTVLILSLSINWPESCFILFVISLHQVLD